jgi:uncharacterized protein YegP (UPF0339 family)
MATATKKPRASRRIERRAAETNVPPAMEFLIFKDNGGSYRWRICARDGATLARSGDFASYEDAEGAAQRVRDGAASARLERRATEALPVDLTARRDAARRDASSDDSDAERWLDEGGSFSSEAVTKWPVPQP